jgi:hypothetical protein
MHFEWLSFSAFRSDSSECPTRMGVRNGASASASAVEKGLAAGGERRRRRCAWTCARVVVTGRSCSAVMPDHLDRF